MEASDLARVFRFRVPALFLAWTVLAALFVVFGSERAGADAYVTGNGDRQISAGGSIWVGNCELRMQTDGNLVLYRHLPGGGVAVEFATYTFGTGHRAKLQVDGNLVVYNSSWVWQWQSYTGGNPGSSWVMTKNCSLKAYNSNSQVLYTASSGTSGSGLNASHPSGHGYADASPHYWASTETNPSDKSEWIWRFRGPGGEHAVEPTDLTFSEWSTAATWVDVWWFVQSQSADGQVWCSHPHSGVCDRFYLTISETAENNPSHMQNNLVCHELGHTIAFDDGGTTQTSCMTGGHTAQFNSTEINVINSRW